MQILGAEKALFRALKTKGNTPKYGLIYHSTFIGRADAKNKGRISRYLANKCSIATRIDAFADKPSSVYGQKLRDQVEERLKFYETGAAPRKNIDVMEEVARHLKAGQDAEDEMSGGKKKKKKDKKTPKKRKAEDDEAEDDKAAKKSAKKAKKEALKTPEKSAEEATPSKEKVSYCSYCNITHATKSLPDVSITHLVPLSGCIALQSSKKSSSKKDKKKRKSKA